jgi:hypothetical protein
MSTANLLPSCPRITSVLIIFTDTRDMDTKESGGDVISERRMLWMISTAMMERSTDGAVKISASVGAMLLKDPDGLSNIHLSTDAASLTLLKCNSRISCWPDYLSFSFPLFWINGLRSLVTVTYLNNISKTSHMSFPGAILLPKDIRNTVRKVYFLTTVTWH